MSLMSYFSKMKRLWDEIQSIRKFPVCSCGILSKCTCSFLKRLSDFEGEEKLMKFLLGLNNGFDNTIANILAMDPLPPLNRAYAIASQIEKQKEIAGMQEGAQEASAMVAQKGAKNGPSGQQRGVFVPGKKDWKKDKLERKCEHCKGRGHTIDQCFKIIGYPDWYPGLKGGKNGAGGSKMVANVQAEGSETDSDNPLDQETSGKGHSSMDLRMINVVVQEVMKAMKGKRTLEEKGAGTRGAAFTSCAGNINLSNNCKTGLFFHDKDAWIIDSGATDHMTYDETLLDWRIKHYLRSPFQ
jgi:hypothetical protein